jgi:pimeloyl-ACP methyl ester carboxylesterase
MTSYLTLTSGHTLAYAEYGSPDGYPVFFFHGWPGSRLQPEIHNKTAKRINLRIICPDRPGYGCSDFNPNRTLLDWPDTVTELADYLNIDTCSVIGNSGGGPYAAVSAYKLPKRIRKAAIVVGLAPTTIDGVLEGMSRRNTLTWRAYHAFPFLIPFAAYLQTIRKQISPDNPIGTYPSTADHDILTKDTKKSIARNRKEAFRQGIKGAAHDLRLYTSDWGFDLKDITTPVSLWYGKDDKSVSYQMGEYYAERIPKSTLRVYKNIGHLVLAKHTEEILGDLM